MNRRTPFWELPAPTLADRRIITQGDDGVSLLAADVVREVSTNSCDHSASVARSVSFASADPGSLCCTARAGVFFPPHYSGRRFR
jgi:hypothetical protein